MACISFFCTSLRPWGISCNRCNSFQSTKNALTLCNRKLLRCTSLISRISSPSRRSNKPSSDKYSLCLQATVSQDNAEMLDFNDASPEEVPPVIDFEKSILSMSSAVKVIPHPDKVEKGGEDAYFISGREGGVICVIDGVGGWAEDGVDPALYSKEFAMHAKIAAEADDDMFSDPIEILNHAHNLTKSVGAATAIIALLNNDKILRIANLGDCGVSIVRDGEIVFKAPPLQHFFDCPFQFGSESSDTVADAKVYDILVEEGDTIIMGSDGLFDNVFDSDMRSIVNVFSGNDISSAERTASALAALAFKNSQDDDFDSPYAIDARDNGQDLPFWQKLLGKKLTGGKPDDITVVVGKIIKTEIPIPQVSADEDSKTPTENGINEIISETQIIDDSNVSIPEEEKNEIISEIPGSDNSSDSEIISPTTVSDVYIDSKTPDVQNEIISEINVDDKAIPTPVLEDNIKQNLGDIYVEGKIQE